MEMAWTPGIGTVENESQDNRGAGYADSRWFDTTKYPQVRRTDQGREDTGIRTEDADEPAYVNGTGGKRTFNLGIERTRQRNVLRNEVYAQVLSAKMEMERAAEGCEIGLKQILRAIDQLPWTSMEGRVYVCDDGEMGIVWESEGLRVELSAGVLPTVEYLIWEDDGNTGMESEWDVDGEQQIPTSLKEALEKKR